MEQTTQTMPNRMLDRKVLTGIITVETGLHIGGSSDTIEIGGMDNPIIINPVTKEPYIPGSSLKGKMRSLLEWKLGKIVTTGGSKKIGQPYPYDRNDKDNHPISRIFGTTADDAMLGPSRLIVRDAFVSKSYKEKMEKKNPNWTYMDLRETKTENAINRITAQANPRPLERAVPGVEFKFEIIYRIFDLGDNGKIDSEFFKYVLEALELVELDALGGAGSRGCGKVSFKIDINGALQKLSSVKVEDIN
jgi:CRISPR-associated protein Csm3